MSYSVKEIFLTLQGEGARAGQRSVFVRFAGCNLWTGREEDRGKGAACSSWCDTDFLGGWRADRDAIVAAVRDEWGDSSHHKWVVLTGGEPTLQVDDWLVGSLQRAEFCVAIETNGTRHCSALDVADWVTVSPKKGSEWVVRKANELKVVLPGWEVHELDGDFQVKYVQPCDGVPGALDVCKQFLMDNPGWRLSVQTHKLLQIR